MTQPTQRAQDTAPLQRQDTEDNIYDEVYEMPEGNEMTGPTGAGASAKARPARGDSQRQNSVPSYYVE